MNSQVHSSKPPTGRSRPRGTRRLGRAVGADGVEVRCVDGHQSVSRLDDVGSP